MVAGIGHCSKRLDVSLCVVFFVSLLVCIDVNNSTTTWM